MPRSARRPLFVFTCLFFLIFLYNRHTSIPSQGSHSVASNSIKTSNGHSSWAKHAQRYPVTTFRELPTGQPLALPQIQARFGRETAKERGVREYRLAAVRDSFKHAWQGYREHAWLSDELLPLSHGSHEAFGNWSATLVDSLDTLWIMGLHEEFDEAVAAVGGIDFESSTSKIVSVFETTIRYLGGLLAAYDLSGLPLLLEKATHLGEMLYAAFDTENRMPVSYWDWKSCLEGGDQSALSRAVSADVGSLSLEFTRLSQLTGDPKFFDAVQRVSEAFGEQQNSTLLPGLWPLYVNAMGNDFASGSEFSIGAMADSLYEYLPKMHMLLGGLVPMYGEMHLSFVTAATDWLFFRPMNPDDRDILMSGIARVNGDQVSLDDSGQHLACFIAGVVGIGGKIFHRDKDVEVAARLADGCVWAYHSFESGIMPEMMDLTACPHPDACAWDEKAWHRAVMRKAGRSEDGNATDIIKSKHLPPGFTNIPDTRYILRPEAIESVLIMYRITGDVRWQDKAWEMFSAIEKATRTEVAHASLENVAINPPKQVDKMESFWTAETLKYFYLTFSEPDLVSLDEYVFNTEAHPFRRPKVAKSWWWKR